MKTAYAYLGHRIQEADHKVRPGTGHNCEIDARNLQNLEDRIRRISGAIIEKIDKNNDSLRVLGKTLHYDFDSIKEKWNRGLADDRNPVRLNEYRLMGRTINIPADAEHTRKKW